MTNPIKSDVEGIAAVFGTWNIHPTIKKILYNPQLEIINKLWERME